MTDKKSIGKSLQTMRKAVGFKTAKSFAEHMGYNVGTYTNWEQGKQIFSFGQAWDMADALHCTLDELGGRKPPLTETPVAPDEQTLLDGYRSIDSTARLAVRQLVDTLSPEAGSAQEEGVA